MPPRLCESCSYLRLQQRAFRSRPSHFSTSAPTLAQIPPESPRFIEIPRPVQPHQPYPNHPKGILPIPRAIIRRRPRPQDPDKASPEYLADVTPEPFEDKTSPPANSDHAERVGWKARQAEARRRNLRESLVELSHRKQKTDRFLQARSNRKLADRKRRLEAPEREDEWLTNPTVLQSQRPVKHHVVGDPHREARLARKRENVARTEAMRQEVRKDQLHTLYVNSGNFITTGEQLNTVIDRVFDDPNQFTNDQEPGLNIWNLGYPETISELLSKVNKDPRSQKAIESAEGNTTITRQRMRRIAEELTGGKIKDLGADADGSS